MDYDQGKVDYHQVWKICADCDKVQIVSILFYTDERYDKVIIDGTIYSGERIPNNPIDLIVPNSFIVSFLSDDIQTADGFILMWQCYNESSNILKGILTTSTQQS